MPEVDDIAILDAPKSTPPESKEDLLRNWLQKTLERQITDIPLHSSRVSDIHTNGLKTHRSPVAAHIQRDIENTYHPSQIHCRKFKALFAKQINQIRKAYEDNPDCLDLSPAGISLKAKSIVDEIIGEFLHYELNLKYAGISSNARLKEAELEKVKKDFEDGKEIELIESSLPKDFITTNPNPLDETWETVADAKDNLIWDGGDIHSVWIDFDGARRPEGIMFSIYAALIWEDIQYGFRITNLEDKAELEVSAKKEYNDFLKVDVMIHALTSVLQNKKGEAGDLEKRMKKLITRRKLLIEKLITIRNSIEKQQSKSGETKMVFLSKRIRFHPRFDYKFVVALKQFQKNRQAIDRGELSGEDRYKDVNMKAIQTLWAVGTQIRDINGLAQNQNCFSENATEEKHCSDIENPQPVVPQIILSMAQDTMDIALLIRILENSQSESDFDALDQEGEFGSVTDKITVVPLFEEEATTNPERIENFLETLWSYYRKDTIKLETRVNEIFFAGSDLSREMGQVAAITRIWAAACAIDTFNKKNGANIKIKLGTGETLFRQAGFFDSRAFLPMIRGKITGTNPQLSEAETISAAEGEDFLKRKFGENWREVLIRPPAGYNYLLKKYPFISFFTQQSRAREMRLIEIPPSQILALIEDFKKTRDDNLEAIREKGLTKPPAALVNFGEEQKVIYQKFIGSATDKAKPGNMRSLAAIIELLAKKIPATRDRGATRAGRNKQSYPAQLEGLLKPGINTRAIGANTASRMIFPLALVGFGTALEAATQKGEVEEVLPYLNPRETLREIKNFEVIAEDVFAILRNNGFEQLEKELKQEWAKILAERESLQNQIWEEIDPNGKSSLRNSNLEEKKKMAALLVPSLRELLDPENQFESNNAKVRRKIFQHQGKRILVEACRHLKEVDNFEMILEEAVSEILGQGSQTERKKIREHVLTVLEKNDREAEEQLGLTPNTRNNLASAFNTVSKLEFTEEDTEALAKFLAEFSFTSGSLG